MGDRQTFQVMPSAAAGTPDAGPRARARCRSATTTRSRGRTTTASRSRTASRPRSRRPTTRRCCASPSPATTRTWSSTTSTTTAALTLDPATGAVTGCSDVGSGLSDGAHAGCSSTATFDQPVTGGGTLTGGRRRRHGLPDASTPAQTSTVTMRIATSLISVDQAKHNLALEIAPADTFDDRQRRARQRRGTRKLGVVEVEGATDDQLTTLYSNLYRLYLYPNSAFENTGTARRRSTSTPAPFVGRDRRRARPTHDRREDRRRQGLRQQRLLGHLPDRPGRRTRCSTPTQAGEMVDGFVQQYRDGGWISRWSSPGLRRT